MFTSLFCSQVFETTSNVLNFDVPKYCKYCFDCFLLTGGDKVGSLADVKFTLELLFGLLADSLLQFSFVLALL